jgi:hypothetical protein
VKVEIGDLVEDRHYGLGTVEATGHDGVSGEKWVRAFFPKFPHLAPGGFIRLYGTHARALKVISKK